MNKAKIGAILKNRIKEQGFTQEEFAEKVGIGLSTLKKYTKGENTYNYELLEKFADTLNCSYDYLLGKSKTAQKEHTEIREKINLSDKAIGILIERTQRSKSDDEQAYFMKTLDLLIENENIIDDIAFYLIINKSTGNFFNQLFSYAGLDVEMPYNNEIYLLIPILMELKGIKSSTTEETIKEFNKSAPNQLLDAFREIINNYNNEER